MGRVSYFFERHDYSGGIKQPHYRYKGYRRALEGDQDDDILRYPVSLHFDRDEIIFTFQERDGRTHRLFSLYVAEGALNQQMLIRKVEHYWKMPVWSLRRSSSDAADVSDHRARHLRRRRPACVALSTRRGPLPSICRTLQSLTQRDTTQPLGVPEAPRDQLPADDGGEEKILLDPGLLGVSFFGVFTGVEVLIDGRNRWRIDSWRPFRRGNRRDDEILILATNEGQRVRFLRYGCQDTPAEWHVRPDGTIETDHINFRQLLLDFLFELDNARTFEDKNFFRLQPILQNNILLDALSRKSSYLAELYGLQGYERASSREQLPKPFREAEASWLQVCFQERYRELFVSADSVFDTVEKEVENVFFDTRIGRIPKPRVKRLSRGEVGLRNQAATFFLRRYSIMNAFKVLLPPVYLVLILVVMAGMLFGDYVGHVLFGLPGGIFSVGLPLLGLAGIVGCYVWQGINLFKLLLPRMFLGIVVGWAAFWDTEEAWETALLNTQGEIVLIWAVLSVVLCLYVFTNISNKLSRIPAMVVFRRTIGLVSFAMLISLVVGFYVIQFKAVPVLQVSGFLTRQNLGIEDRPQHFDPTLETTAGKWRKYYYYLEKEDGAAAENMRVIVGLWKDPKQEHIDLLADMKEEGREKRIFGLDNFVKVPSFWGGWIYFIWSMHLSQFMVAIMIGVILQMLWEDRAITEPL